MGSDAAPAAPSAMMEGMGGFLGGSAYAMAQSIAEGLQAVSDRTFRSMKSSEVDQLAFELDRCLREIRAEQPALDDLPTIQQRNRRIQRLNQAFMVLKNYQARARRV